MKILYVTTYCLADRARGGGVWVDNLIVDALRQRFDIDTFTAIPPVVEDTRARPFRASMSLAGLLVTNKPFQETKFIWQPAWRKQISRLRKLSGSYDLIVTSQWVGLLLADSAGVKVDLHVAHNVDTVNARYYSNRILRLFRERFRVAAREKELLKKPRRVLALSTNDVHRIAAVKPGVRHLRLVSPKGHDRRITLPHAVGFIGTMRWGPNVKAFESLVEIIDRFNRQSATNSLTIRVAGRYSSELAPREHVEVLGELTDLDEFYSSIGAVVVPRFGPSTGISVKVAEALSHGVFVIASSSLASALDAADVLCADDAPQTVDALSDIFVTGERVPSTLQRASGSASDEGQTLELTALANWLHERERVKSTV